MSNKILNKQIQFPLSGSFTGSLFGTASYATTASYVIGGGGSGTGFPFSGSAVITGSLLVSGSGLTITGSLNVTNGITGSLLGTASFATTASNITPAFTGIIANTNNNVLTSNGDGTVTGESNLYFDGTNLGIGKTNPSVPLDVLGNTNLSGSLNISGSTTTNGNFTFTAVNRSIVGSNSTTTVAFGGSLELGGFSNILLKVNGAIRGTIYDKGNFTIANNANDVTDRGYRIAAISSGSATAQVSGSLYTEGFVYHSGIISGSAVANNPSSSIMQIGGTITPTGSLTGASAIFINPIMSASANNQTLNGLDIALTVNTGSSTGTISNAIRVGGNITPSSNNIYSIGATNFRFSNIFTGGSIYTPAIRATTLVFGNEGGTEYGRFTSNGNFLVGTTADTGYKVNIGATGTSGSLFVSGSSTFAGNIIVTGSLTVSASTAQFLAQNGTVTNPAYSFSNDTNTGFRGVGSGGTQYVASGLGYINFYGDSIRVNTTNITIRDTAANHLLGFRSVNLNSNGKNNYIRLANADTGSATNPRIEVTTSGTDTNISLDIVPLGTGSINLIGITRITGSAIVTGSLIMDPSGSFTLPLTSSTLPSTGSMYWSGSLLFVYNGTRYMSASFV